jgi:hypothetical protein
MVCFLISVFQISLDELDKIFTYSFTVTTFAESLILNFQLETKMYEVLLSACAKTIYAGARMLRSWFTGYLNRMW